MFRPILFCYYDRIATPLHWGPMGDSAVRRELSSLRFTTPIIGNFVEKPVGLRTGRKSIGSPLHWPSNLPDIVMKNENMSFIFTSPDRQQQTV